MWDGQEEDGGGAQEDAGEIVGRRWTMDSTPLPSCPLHSTAPTRTTPLHSTPLQPTLGALNSEEGRVQMQKHFNDALSLANC